MPTKKKTKKPHQKHSPPNRKKARGIKKAQNTENAFCAWNTNYIDCGGRWSWNNIDPKIWWDYICKARDDFKTMKWSEIIGKHHHPIDVCKIIPEAQKRLEEINQHDTDVLYSFTIGGSSRIWGIRERSTFKVLWWDPDHEIYPVDKRYT